MRRLVFPAFPRVAQGLSLVSCCVVLPAKQHEALNSAPLKGCRWLSQGTQSLGKVWLGSAGIGVLTQTACCQSSMLALETASAGCKHANSSWPVPPWQLLC